MHSGSHARRTYGALALCTIVAGLVVHWYGTILPGATRDVLGDALWAMMIVWLIGAVVPQKPIVARAALALVVCWVVEFSQAYHQQFLDSVRNTAIGQLVLGSGFDVRDLGAYALGVAAALGLELAASRTVPPRHR
jgi:hypothetical protein